MPARTTTIPRHSAASPPTPNEPISHRRTKTSRNRHHCPHKLNGLHCLNPRCLSKKHVGYCETCKYIASPYHGCNKCGTRRLSDVPPSRLSQITGEGIAENKIVTEGDVLYKNGEDEDKGWSKEEERRAREQAKARAVQGKGKKEGSKSKDVSQAKIEEIEKARKEQQKQTDKTRGFKGLFRRK